MKIFVKVKTRAREEKVEKIDEDHFVVKVKEAPEKGKANDAVIRVLADYFKIPILNVKIVSGLKNKNKILEIQKQN